MEKILLSLLLAIIFLALFPSLFPLKQIQTIQPSILEIPEFTKNISYQTATIRIPAVDNEGNGVVTILKVQAMPGEGRVLVNINQLLFWIDTQYSIRVAKIVAQNITGLNLTNVDLIYSIETNASLIEGQSAGAAMTIATVAALQNKTVNPEVMMTGTINPDGSIGSVGAIVAKAKASKDVGAKIFLVPFGQATQTYYKPEQKCEKIGPVTFCTTEYKAERVDVSKNVGIKVKEVSNIHEALKYFLA